jgi:hypothetical protein
LLSWIVPRPVSSCLLRDRNAYGYK